MFQTRQAVVVLGIAALFSLLGIAVVLAAELFLLLFGAVILAVLIRSLSDFLSAKSPLSPRIAFGLVTLVLLGLMSFGAWALGPVLAEQLEDLIQRLPALTDRLEELLRKVPLGGALAGEIRALGDGGEDVLGGVLDALSLSVRGVVWLLVVVVTGFYLAAEPTLYTRGVLKLFSISRRDRAGEILFALGSTLRLFLLGRIVSMMAVGVMTWIGLSLMGVPAAGLLGLIAGLFTFVPYAGPIAATLPIALAAFLEGPEVLIYAVAYYAAVQSVEGFIITPLVQEKAVMLPPALTLAAEVFMGLLFGVLGVIVSVPAAALAVRFVRMVYVEDVLGDNPSME